MDTEKLLKYKRNAALCMGVAASIILVMVGSGALFGGGSVYFALALYCLFNIIFSTNLHKRKMFLSSDVWVALFLNIINLIILFFSFAPFHETGEEGILYLPVILIAISLFFLVKYLNFKNN